MSGITFESLLPAAILLGYGLGQLIAFGLDRAIKRNNQLQWGSYAEEDGHTPGARCACKPDFDPRANLVWHHPLGGKKQ